MWGRTCPRKRLYRQCRCVDLRASSRTGPLPQGHTAIGPNPRQHKGEPKLPFKSLHVLFSYCFRAACCCFWRPIPLQLLSDPHPGYKSKRIFLSADLLLINRSNQFGTLPDGSFIVLCPVAGSTPGKAHPLQKNLLAASLCRCSCYVRADSSYFYWFAAFYSCYAGDIAGRVPTF